MAARKQQDYIAMEETVESQEHRSQDFDSLSLPPFDKGLGTRKLLLIGFIISCIWAAIITLWGIIATALKAYSVRGSMPPDFPGLANMLTLLFAAITTICSEVLGYIHTISLRWALANEGKLEFNSNLRLFTTSRVSRTNGLGANYLWIFSLILCYGGAVNTVFDFDSTSSSWIGYSPKGSTLTPGEHKESSSAFYTDIPSTLIMGIGLIGLCVLTGIGWRAGERSGRIKSWNPHPLNTALVCAHHGFLARTSEDSSPDDARVGKSLKLKPRNSSARQLIPSLRYGVGFFFSMSLITLILALIILITMVVQNKPYRRDFTWVFFPVGGNMASSTSQLMIVDPTNLYEDKTWCSVLWNSFWQMFPTLTFHIAELVVNLHRDETCWRSISSSKGAKFEQNALLAAFSNKGSIALLILKPLGQWLFSLGVFAIGFNSLPLFVLSALVAALTLSTFIIAHHQPKGPLPATYGHLQSLMNLVDDWGSGAQGRLWWGDKGTVANPATGMSVRRMGTSGNKEDINEIHAGEEYITI